MIQKIKMFILSFSSLFLLVLPLAASGSVSAAINQGNINQNLCSGSNGDLSGHTTGNCGDQATSSVNHLITVIINILSVVVGIIAVIMIIIAGLKYVTSGGSDEAVKSAKNTILYAIIGLVIVALAQLIVHFVLNKTTNATTGA